jgi:tetratricopeptide (TPR) repeat protein
MIPNDYSVLVQNLGRQGRLAEPIEVARQGTIEFPSEGTIWQSLGLVAHASGDFSAAREALESASSLIPLSNSAQMALADVYIHHGQRSLAQVILRHLTKTIAVDAVHWPILGTLWREAGFPRAAMRVWRKLSVNQPTLAEAHYQMALCLREMGADEEELLEPLTEASLLAPESLIYRLALAEVWIHLEEFEQASAVVQDVDIHGVSCIGCLRRIAQVFEMSGEPKRSCECRTRIDQLLSSVTKSEFRG